MFITCFALKTLHLKVTKHLLTKDPKRTDARADKINLMKQVTWLAHLEVLIIKADNFAKVIHILNKQLQTQAPGRTYTHTVTETSTFNNIHISTRE